MNLCIDIGNTRAKYALFDQDVLISRAYVETANQADLLKAINLDHVSNTIICSTGKLLKSTIDLLTEKTNKQPILLSHKLLSPIKLNYNTPETLGLDRIATSVGSINQFPDENRLIIDAGTCITLDVVDKNNVFQGGNITPGISLRIKAMNDYTDKLPIVPLAWNGELLGKNTEEALQNGAVLGTILEIESFISRISEKYSDLKVIITGGDKSFFVDRIKTKIFAAPHLLMFGLNELIKHNEI